MQIDVDDIELAKLGHFQLQRGERVAEFEGLDI